MKRVFTGIALIALAGLSVVASAAEITIGTGAASWVFPLETSSDDARTQIIYLASELGGPYQIQSLALDVTTLAGQTMNNFTVRMKHTTLSSYATESRVWQSNDWTVVYQSNEAITSKGWHTLIFGSPFDYNGLDNLMVDISFNNTAHIGHIQGMSRYSTPGGYRSLYRSTDSWYGDPLTWTGSTPSPDMSTFVPNIKLLAESVTGVPTFDPEGGQDCLDQNVTINCPTPGATIHYTVSGTDPTEADSTIQSGSSLAISPPALLKARAWRTGMAPSAVKSAFYNTAAFKTNQVTSWPHPSDRASRTQQYWPKLASNGDLFMATWYERYHEGSSGWATPVYASRISASGEVLDPAGIVISDWTGAYNREQEPVICRVGMSFWVLYGAYTIGTEYVLAKPISPQGTVGGQIDVGQGEGYSTVTGLAADAIEGGNVLVAFRCGGDRLSYSVLSPSGNSLINSSLLYRESAATFIQEHISVRASDSGFLVLFHNGEHLAGMRVDGAGNLIDSTPINIADFYGGFTANRFAVDAIREANGWLVVYDRGRGSGVICGKRVSDSGTVSGELFEIHNPASKSDSNTPVAAAGDCTIKVIPAELGFQIAWSVSDALTGQQYATCYYLGNDFGIISQNVIPAARSGSQLQIARNTQGRRVAVWSRGYNWMSSDGTYDERRLCGGTYGTSISWAKGVGDGQGIWLAGSVISAAWDNAFYAEADDRHAGVRVERASHGLHEGMRGDVVGIMRTNSDGERYIEATNAAQCASPNSTGSVAPLGLSNWALGGGAKTYLPSSPWPTTLFGQNGVKDGVGLNNIGLLVRSWGRIVERDTATPAAWFRIDDGSGVGVKCVVPSGAIVNPGWLYVGVTGISSCEKIGDDLLRVIRIRNAGDIQANLP